MSELYVGLMSGTSLDGIDAALVDFSNGIHVVHALTADFPQDLRDRLAAIIDGPQSVSLDMLGETDAWLGETYAGVVKRLLDEAGMTREAVAAIGCHGQTIRHSPDLAHPFTWQLGDPNRLAALTGLVTVADFRRMDMAYGGQGAPLVPAFHQACFGRDDEVRAVINIGGISNLTRLGKTVIGYDIGPGNGLMNEWIRERRGEPFDRDGEWASSGRISESLLAAFLADPFFSRPPPRSTGREHFNLAWVKRHIERYPLDDADVQATLLALTATSIAKECREAEARRVLVCGGGTRNVALMKALERELAPLPVESTGQHGLDPDFVEAAAFAWLAQQRLASRPGNLPSVTGATQAAPLGSVYLPGV